MKIVNLDNAPNSRGAEVVQFCLSKEGSERMCEYQQMSYEVAEEFLKRFDIKIDGDILTRLMGEFNSTFVSGYKLGYDRAKGE